MSPSDAAKGILRIKGASPFTEIRILDAAFEPVALDANTGNIEALLDPGLYQVGFRQGTEWVNAHVLLGEGEASVDLDAPEARAPSQWSEVPELVAARTFDAANVLVELEAGQSSLVPKDEADAIEVVLVSPAGEVTRPLHAEAVVPGTWRFFVHPGYWRLRISGGGDAAAFEIPITACPGWMVQVACTARPPEPDDPLPRATAVDLERLRIRLIGAGEQGLAIGDDHLACEDTALASLASSRVLHGSEFEQLLRESLKDLRHPMLGLCAAHLLVASQDETSAPIDDVVEALDQATRRHPSEPFLLETVTHPDVAALRLRVRLSRGEPLDGEPPIPFPPSLLAGWKVLLEAARIRPDLIPEGSISARVAGQIWSASTWVAWSAEALDQAAAPPPRPNRSRAIMAKAAPQEESVGASAGEAAAPEIGFEAARDIIVAGFAHERLRDWFRDSRTAALSCQGAPSPLRSELIAVAGALRPVLSDEAHEEIARKAGLRCGGGECSRDLDTLSEQCALPPHAAAAACAALAGLLLGEARRAGIDLERRTPMARPELIIPYDPAFLGDGFVVPMPTLTDATRGLAFADGAVIDYCHYSLVLRQDRRIAFFTANNVDAAQKVSVSGGLDWHMDERVGEYQIGRETYDRNQIDKGHLVRREDVLWGSLADARAANKATYFYTNASPQHQNFNQDEWKSLEDWVLQRATDLSYRLCVFTGPVLTEDDPLLEDLPPDLRSLEAWGPAQLPAAFWKVIVLRDAEAGGADLAAIAFAMKQSEMWNDKNGRRLVNLALHQVTIGAIEQWTGLDFGALRDVDELAFSPARSLDGDEATWPTVRSAQDIAWSGPERRAHGRRAQRLAAPGRSLLPGSAAAPAHCCETGFDAQAAVAALSRDVARITGLLAQTLPEEPQPGGPRAVGEEAEDPRLADADDPRVEAIAAAADDEHREAVRGIARLLVGQSDVTRGLRTVPEPRELLRIVGGQDVPVGAFPHCVCIGTPDRWLCTGALVAPQVVLTAAHCGPQISRIAIGSQVSPGLSQDTRMVAVQRAVVHPAYRRHPYNENDISVLILAAPAMATPAGLARQGDTAAAAGIHLVGFGYNDPERPIGFGRKRHVSIDLPVTIRGGQLGDTTQLESLLGFHGDYEFFSGRKALGRDSCNGDSGGPAYIKVGNDYRLAGLTSRASREAVVNCGDGGIYVRPEYFREWINGIVTAAGLPPINW